MTKTDIRHFIHQEQFDPEMEHLFLTQLENYPQEELSPDQLAAFAQFVTQTNADLDERLAALQAEDDILGEMYQQKDQLEADAEKQIAEIYQQGLQEIDQLLNEVKTQVGASAPATSQATNSSTTTVTETTPVATSTAADSAALPMVNLNVQADQSMPLPSAPAPSGT